MRLYFARHGESFGNIEGQYDMSLAGSLTPRGQEQARELAGRLSEIRFDAVVVSPLERTVLTAVPHLERSGGTAEAWTELVEIRGQKDIPQELPPAMRYGPPAIVHERAAGLVSLRPEPEARLLPPEKETYVEGLRRARQAAGRLLELWGGRDVTVLMVGHACSGARVLEALMGIALDGRFQHRNCGVTSIAQKANGEFIMRYMNRVEGAL